MHIKAQCRSRTFLALRTRWLLGTHRGCGCGEGVSERGQAWRPRAQVRGLGWDIETGVDRCLLLQERHPRCGARRWSEAGERRMRSSERRKILSKLPAMDWTFSTCRTPYQQLGELDPHSKTLQRGDHLIQGFLNLNVLDICTG